MTLKEIAAIAMDEADLYEAAQDALGEQEVAEDMKKNFYKAQRKMSKKGANTAPASANPKKPKDPATTGPAEIKENKEAKHARDYPGSFGNPECYSKNKDGCPRHKTGIFADKGSQYAKLDASGQQVYATEEQRKNAPDDEQDKLEEVKEKEPVAAPAAETEKVVEEVKVVLADPNATQEKKAEAEQKVVSTLAPAEQGNVATLNALSEQGNGDKVIEAMEKVSANEVATENDKVAAAFIAETALETMKKQNASAEAVRAAEQKVQSIKDAAKNAAGSDKAQDPAPQNGTLKARPSAEMQKKLADAVKNSFGKLYDDFVEDVRNVADGQCFAAGDDESEDHYFVKKDGKIYRADANDQPVGDALSEEEVMCAMIGEGHLWVDGKRTAGGEAPQPQQQTAAPAQAQAPSPVPASAPAPQGSGTPAPAQVAPAQPVQPQMPSSPEDMAKMIAEQENQLKEAAKAKATQEMNADWQKAMAETDPQKRLEAMKAVQAKYASALAAIDNPVPQAQAPAQPAQTATPAAPAVQSPAPAAAPAEEAQPAQQAQEPAAEYKPLVPRSLRNHSPTQSPAKEDTPAPQQGEAKSTETSSASAPQSEEASAETAGSNDAEAAQVAATVQAQKESDPDFEEGVKFVESLAAEGKPIELNGDSGANTMVKADDGKFYRVDEEGKPTGRGYTAEEAYAEITANFDEVKEGETIEDHMKNCKANPKSRCPFLRKHMAEMSPTQQHEIFGGTEPPKSDGQPVTAPALSKLVSDGIIGEGLARAVEKGLTAESTGITDPEQLDALRDIAAQNMIEHGSTSVEKSLARLNELAKNGAIDPADITTRDRAVQNAIESAFGQSTQTKASAAEERIRQLEKATGRPLSEEHKNRLRQMMTSDGTGNMSGLVDGVAAASGNRLMDEAVSNMSEALGKEEMKQTDLATLATLKDQYSAAKSSAAKMAIMKKIEALHDKYVVNLNEDDDAMHQQGMPSVVSEYASDGDVWDPEVKGFGEEETVAENTSVADAVEEAKKSIDVAEIPAKLSDIDISQNQNTTTITIPFERYIKGRDGKDRNIPKNRYAALLADLKANVPEGGQVEVDKKGVVITLPNTTKGFRSFGKILQTQEWRDAVAKGPGAVCLGVQSEDGKPIISSLKDLVHLFIGGDTGKGKSSRIANVIGSLCSGTSPDDVEVIAIDPKGNGLEWMDKFPHCSDRITDMNLAVKKLGWLLNEMTNRQKLLEKYGAANIEAYNKMGKEGKLPPDAPQKLKYIVPVIDEFADLIATHGKEVSVIMQRIGNMARSSGIHMIAATQRPDAKQLPKSIMGPFTSRMGLYATEPTTTKMIMGNNKHMLNDEKMNYAGRFMLDINGAGKAVMGDGSYVKEEDMAEVGKGMTKKWDKFKNKSPKKSTYAEQRDSEQARSRVASRFKTAPSAPAKSEQAS